MKRSWLVIDALILLVLVVSYAAYAHPDVPGWWTAGVILVMYGNGLLTGLSRERGA